MFFHEVIAFYLDGVSFVHKPRPMAQISAPKGTVSTPCGIFLDFSKAFDTVNHNIFLLISWNVMVFVV
jgi:hypothetical protein